MFTHLGKALTLVFNYIHKRAPISMIHIFKIYFYVKIFKSSREIKNRKKFIVLMYIFEDYSPR